MKDTTMTDTHIHTFLNAAQNVINDALAAAKQAEPQDYAGLTGVMRAGGLLRLQATFAPLTGQALMQIVVCEPSGTEHTLSQCELHKIEAI